MSSMIGERSSLHAMEEKYILELLKSVGYDRGEVHAQKTTSPEMVTKEIRWVNMSPLGVGEVVRRWADIVEPNLPWAENHFQERVGGEPLNPPPEELNWPYAQQGNAAHKEGEKFSHTYPERFWPKWANGGQVDDMATYEHYGIRFAYGDLNDLVEVLRKNPRSRQAYLPVWFPEDLTAARENKRVPCTLGYHFMSEPPFDQLSMTYSMRSCDIVRFWRDDIYMAGRLLQWVCVETGMTPGNLRLNIDSLHCFEGDRAYLEGRMADLRKARMERLSGGW